MIQLKSLLKCIDNTGALILECINVIGRRKSASLGSEIVCVVKQTKPPSTLPSFQTTMQNKVKKGDVVRAVVCRVRKETRRRDGSTIRFDDNACVVINKQGQPVGNRVVGCIANEVRQKRWSKIVSLAPKIV